MQQNNEAAGTVKVTDDVKTVEDRNPTLALDMKRQIQELFEEYYNDEGSDDLRQFLRFSRADFDSLHETLRANLEKPRNHTYPISSKHRLAVFLRFIGHGPSFKAMETSFGIGYTTVYKIILEVAHAVLDSSLQLPLPTTDDLVASAKEFERSWNFPNCIAALDGKHIRTKVLSSRMFDDM
ncbi:hypothetical protein QR680_015545 [Steinernema hermaphroditum]|uniref:Transposase Helix-turn-helix domain-containing protein n=1 Tax=Steinernema hermaphroditum TaxID=289476 RepID=A0AA39H943_9BILA|nr:hypothetical protein QR680_015545 [Steinernema hermaphroditum]